MNEHLMRTQQLSSSVLLLKNLHGHVHEVIMCIPQLKGFFYGVEYSQTILAISNLWFYKTLNSNQGII